MTYACDEDELWVAANNIWRQIVESEPPDGWREPVMGWLDKFYTDGYLAGVQGKSA